MALPTNCGEVPRRRYDEAHAVLASLAEMDDRQIHGTIDNPLEEEHELWEQQSTGEAGLDPDTAAARPPEVVEHYRQ